MTEAGVVAEEAHDRKLQKSLKVCEQEGVYFVPLAWESTGGATDMRQSQISVSHQRSLAQAVIDRRVEFSCERVL